MVTGHLHSLKVPYHRLQWDKIRRGWELARPYGQQFLYTEDNPVDWRAGFAVFKFIDGKMMWPQVAAVREEGVMEYCGKIWQRITTRYLFTAHLGWAFLPRRYK